MANRRALIVATGTYQDPKLRQLRAPAADADRLAEVLRDPSIGDFEVDLAMDQDERTLRRRLARFFAAASREDVLLAHFSCHGVKDAQGGLYLATSDSEMDLLEATAIPAVWLDEQLTRSPSRRKLLLLDCCFSGKFPFNAMPRAGQSVDLHERFQGRGRAVITASNAMEYAYEGDNLSGSGHPSYFTAALVDALQTGEADRDQDSWISVDELYDYIFDRVKQISPHQTPTKQIALEGPLYVAHSNFKRPIEPARLDEQLVVLSEHPVAAARLGAAEELARLLGSASPGVALAARNLLEVMRDDDSRRVAERARVALAGETREPAADHVEDLQPTETAEGAHADQADPATTRPADAGLDAGRAPSAPRRRALPRARDLLTSGSGLMLLISLLLPWYYYSGASFWDSGADTGAHELPTIAVVCLAVTGIAALCVSLAPLVGTLRPRGPRLTALVIVLGAVSLLVTVYFGLVHYPNGESTNQFGVAVALIGAIGVTFGAYMSQRLSRQSYARPHAGTGE